MTFPSIATDALTYSAFGFLWSLLFTASMCLAPKWATPRNGWERRLTKRIADFFEKISASTLVGIALFYVKHADKTPLPPSTAEYINKLIIILFLCIIFIIVITVRDEQ